MPGLVEDLSEEINDVQAKLNSWSYRVVTAACDRKEQHIVSMEQHRGAEVFSEVLTVEHRRKIVSPPPPLTPFGQYPVILAVGIISTDVLEHQAQLVVLRSQHQGAGAEES